MDEIEMFASLRPAGSSIDLLVRDDLRSELFGPAAAPRPYVDAPDVASAPAIATTGSSAEVVVLADAQIRPRIGRRSPVLAVAAAVALVVGAVGVWSVTTRRTSHDTAGTSPASVELPKGDLVPPRPVIDDPAWTLTNLGDNDDHTAIGAVAFPATGFSGPSAVVQDWSDGGGVVLGPTTSVPVGSSVGTASSDDTAAVVEWIDAEGNRLRVFGVSLPIDTVVEIARVVSIQNGRAVFAELPNGLVAADAASVDALGRSLEYQFAGPSTNEFGVRTYAGGIFADRARVAGEDRDLISTGDEELRVFDYGDGRYRANVLRGFWAWEFDGSAFASADAFTAFVRSVRVVDEQTWQSVLPSSIAGTKTWAEAVDALLVDVPIPPNVDVEALRMSDRSQSRYPFIATVSGAIVCGWFDLWFNAQAADDQAGMSEAAAALASSRQWPMLLEIADQGGWSDEVWQYADAVNGGPGVATGAGPQPVSRDFARSALGCQF